MEHEVDILDHLKMEKRAIDAEGNLLAVRMQELQRRAIELAEQIREITEQRNASDKSDD